MTYNIDVDFLVFPLKNAKISPWKFATSRKANGEPAVSLVDAIFHLEKDISLGPVHHPREFHLLNRVECHLMHLIW